MLLFVKKTRARVPRASNTRMQCWFVIIVNDFRNEAVAINFAFFFRNYANYGLRAELCNFAPVLKS